MLFLDKTIRSYQATKSALKDFHSVLFEHVHKKEYVPCARSIGLYKKKKIVFPHEACTDMFTDYLIYSWPEKGKSIVDTFSTENADHFSLLSGMQRNVFSVFGVEGLGNHRLKCTDLLREGLVEEVIDFGLSRSASSGFVFISRLLKYDDFCCFSGAGFPAFSDILLEDILFDVASFLDKRKVESPADLGPKDERMLEAMIIKQCVRHRAYENFSTEDV